MGGEACLHAREADEVGTETEASALASRHADRGGDQVKHGEDSRGHEGEGGDLVKGERLTGDKDSSASHHKAFNQILDSAIDNFRDVHGSYIHSLENFFRSRIQPKTKWTYCV